LLVNAIATAARRPKRPMKMPRRNAKRVCHKVALGMESQKPLECDRRSSEAWEDASGVCGLCTAAMFRQSPILRNWV
jgi:hypothetical protein